MKYDFDEIIPREGTASVKYDLRKELFGRDDVDPLWVADMDFATPDFVREAVIKRASHPVYGYTFRPSSFAESILRWMKLRHAWKINKEWVSFSPGVVPALNMLVIAFTNPGDGILIQPPVYFPFFRAVEDHNRKLVINELHYENGRYTIDFDDFEKKATESRLFIFCHPHNPVGRSWNKEELQKMCDICRKNNVLIISDEIHSDLMLTGSRHIPMLEMEGADKITISCYAPSKTFNLAGLSTSFLIIPDSELRSKYEKTLNAIHVGLGNLFGLVALEAAYNEGEEWLDQLLKYLEGNIRFLQQFLVETIPEIRLVKPEATYLMWLDCQKLELSDTELKRFMIHDAGLGLNDGPGFGPGGSGFQRMNLALPHSRLEQALKNLEEAVKKFRRSGSLFKTGK